MLAVRRRTPPIVRHSTQTLSGLNRLFDDVFSSSLGWIERPDGAEWLPSIDVVEDNEAIRVSAEVPGVSRDDLTVSFEDQVLVIRGEKNSTYQESSDRFHRRERRYGAFERQLTVPSSVAGEKIEAAYDAGVLTVTLPKVERARSREIPVSTS